MSDEPFTLVYLESPYCGQIDRNVEYAISCMHDSLSRNEAPFVSHLLYTRVPKKGHVCDYTGDNTWISREKGMAAGFAFAEKCQKSVFYIDLGISPGMKEGIERAKAAGRIIEYRKLAGEWRTD